MKKQPEPSTTISPTETLVVRTGDSESLSPGSEEYAKESRHKIEQLSTLIITLQRDQARTEGRTEGAEREREKWEGKEEKWRDVAKSWENRFWTVLVIESASIVGLAVALVLR